MLFTYTKSLIRARFRYIALIIFALLVFDYFGLFTHIFELDYYKEFNYPLTGDVLKYAKQMRYDRKADVQPINVYNFSYLINPIDKCRGGVVDHTVMSPRVVYLIKSAVENFDRRYAIRKSWGHEKRFSDVEIRTVFLLGVPNYPSLVRNTELVKKIKLEAEQFNDIVQTNFTDSYFNNTIKTMMGFQWAVKFCYKSKFYMFVDDDYYVSTKNVLRFVKDPINYPEYLEEADETIRKLSRRLSKNNLTLNETHELYKMKEVQDILIGNIVNTNIETKDDLKLIRNSKRLHDLAILKSNKEIKRRKRRDLFDRELAHDVRLFSGFVFTSAPHRHKSSKWHIGLDEYPWHMWPPYVTAGAFLLSREALIDMYYVSQFTKHFRFDDIYLGIVALKSQIEPLHSEEFYFHKALYAGPQSYKYVIASHGYDEPQELLKIWAETKAAGHA